MGLSKLNPFKKSPKDNLTVEDDGLAPTKSTSSFAGSLRSIRSFGDKANELMNEGDKPKLPFGKTNEAYKEYALPSLTTGGMAANDGGMGNMGSAGLR